MKAITYIPLMFLISCTSTKVMDQSKHYANYQSYSVSHNDSPKQSQKDSDEVLYRQSSDEDFLNDRMNRHKRDSRTYNVQNYYENSSKPDFNTPVFPINSSTADTQVLPPNLFFRPSEYNPFKNF